MRRLLIIFMLILSAGICSPNTFAQEKPRATRAQELFEQANAALARGEFDAVISTIEEALKVEPSWADLHLKLGIASLFKFVQTRDASFEAKAMASLTRASELNPTLAGPYYYLGIHYTAKKEYEEAIRQFQKAISVDPADTASYTAKWEAQLKKPDFEREIVAIRLEAESLASRNFTDKQRRANALLAAAKGYTLTGDEAEREKVEARFEAEFPEREESTQILFRRAVAEKNKERQADLLEELFSRNAKTRQWPLYSMAFRARATQQNVSGEKLLTLGRAWVDSAGQDSYQKITAMAAVVAVLAERKMNLAEAEAMADDGLKTVAALTPDSVLGGGAGLEEKNRFINFLKELAQRSKGFVLLKKGKPEEAARELNAALQPVIKEVEKNGFILWKDMDLREVGVRPRVLWLGELYEAQGELALAAKYLLAGIGDDPVTNMYIRDRSLAIFKRLGRSADQAGAALAEAERRYKAVSTASANRKDEERKSLIAKKINQPAPDFQVTTLDKRVIKLGELKGKVVVLNFWATWCGPCVVEMPHFQTAARNYNGNTNVVFIAVSVDNNRALVGPFLRRIKYTDLAAYDDGAADSFRIASIPTTIIIDRGGMIQYKDVGFGGEGETYIERLSWRIDELLKEKSDAASTGIGSEKR
jgi:thiol-disulfide isomerase/thioredoxin/Tfp pilus assembly protein PilF